MRECDWEGRGSTVGVWIGGGGYDRLESGLTVSSGAGLTPGGRQHVGETLPRRHHLWVLLVCKVLPDT